MSTEPCEFLQWDSELFNRRIARIREDRLCDARLAEVFHWCRDRKIACLYFLGDVSDPVTVQLAEQNQFTLVDVRLVLSCRPNIANAKCDASNEQLLIRASRSSDIAKLKQIARTNHRDSRFYFDRRFPREDCDRLFETWIERSCRGYAEVVFVGDVAATPSGYVSCHRVNNSSAKIGLLGVSEAARGKGLGHCLVQRALQWFAEQEVEHVTVVTQARNIAAQRLYQRVGFATRSAGLFYHRWFDKPKLHNPIQ